MVCPVLVSSKSDDSDDCVNQLAGESIALEQVSRAHK